MSELRIPKRFKLFGKTVEVVSRAVLLTEHNFVGAADYRLHRIELLPNSDVMPISAEAVGQTFCHELTHFLLYYASHSYSGGEKNMMHTDEGFVDTIGLLLHQALTTMEYE